jgi:hypothetical protein
MDRVLELLQTIGIHFLDHQIALLFVCAGIVVLSLWRLFFSRNNNY